MRRPWRISVAIVVTALCTYLVVCAIIGIGLVRSALQPSRRPLLDEAAFSSEVTQQGSSLQDASITTPDGAILRGWYIQPSNFLGSSVILLHGMADNRQGMEGYALMLLRHHYAVLMPDSRAHGKSGGDIATYGVLETADLHQWGNWLHLRTPDCEYLIGESMGAAIAIQSAPKSHYLCAVVAEDPFATFREIAFDRIAQTTGLSENMAHLIGWPVLESGFVYARLRDRINLLAANPLKAIVDSRLPTLLITGTADHNIPMRHAVALARAGQSHTELWVVDGAHHTGAMQADPQKFEQKVVGWLNDHHQPITN